MEEKPKLLVRESLVAMAKNAEGAKIFRNLYVQNADGSVVDVLNNGELSCAVTVSNMLSSFGLMDRGHATVAATVARMDADELWSLVDITGGIPEEGDVLVWAEVSGHRHIGIYVGHGVAMSNSDSLGQVALHDWQFGGNRLVEQVWRYDFSKYDPK